MQPKWDGSPIWAATVIRSNCSCNERPMTRYFPSWAARSGAELPHRCVIDGEIINIATDHGLD